MPCVGTGFGDDMRRGWRPFYLLVFSAAALIIAMGVAPFFLGRWP